MAQMQIRGTQLQNGTLPLSALVNGYSIPTANLAQGSLFVQSGGSVPFTASQSMGGFTLTNVGSPIASTDAVTKAYADSIKSGIQLKFARVVSTTNQSTLSGFLTIDGYTTVAGDIIFLEGQTTASQNGLWTVASGAWTRPANWSGSLPEGQYIIVDADGTTYKNTKWFVTNTAAITVDTTPVTFTQDQSGTSYSVAANAGLTLSGNAFAVNLASTPGLQISSNALSVLANTTNLISVTASGVGITSGSSSQTIIANASGVPTWATLSGDVTVGNSGVTTVSASTVTKPVNIILNEVVSGTVNGTNTAFTLANAPNANISGSAVMLYQNGLSLRPGAGYDFTISGNAITMINAPIAGDVLIASYFR